MLGKMGGGSGEPEPRHRGKRVEAQLATAQETTVWGSKASLRDCAGLDCLLQLLDSLSILRSFPLHDLLANQVCM